MAEFTHFKKDGSAVMVDVHEKPDTYRAASATGTIQVSPEVFAAVRDHTAKKGDVLGYLHANDEQRLEAAKDKFLNAYAITDSRPETEPLIKGILQ